MCEFCGCGVKSVTVERDLREENLSWAFKVRSLFKESGSLSINLISSPGAGKTTLIKKTIELLGKRYKIAVIEGDIETDIDKKAIEKMNTPVFQINTKGACHLTSKQVFSACESLGIGSEPFDIVFIENVGNLVCPSSFYLGEDIRVTLLSTPEGDDKPMKYPEAFFGSHAVVITKMDLLPYVSFNVEKVKKALRKLNPGIKIFPVSSINGHGMEEWIKFIEGRIK